jgi:predicted Zn-dependent protease
MKQQYGIQIGSAVAGALGMGVNTQSIVQAIVAQGFSFKNLKYSRDHESEADHMGLIFAAMAGYDPQVAVSFWQRMAASSSNQTAEFLSDHPSDATRISQIKGWMPEALKYYNPPKTMTTAKTAAKTTTKTATKTTTKTTKTSSKKK